MFAGLFLSKFDKDGLVTLGFHNANEAFNVIGLALNISPNSVRNHRDEFDPHFPNNRVGRRNREMPKSCKTTYLQYKDLGIAEFSTALKTIIYKNSDLDLLMEKTDADKSHSFAKRLLTGQAAENYFRKSYKEIDAFKNYDLEDTTQFGCGFDFKLTNELGFLGIEVKGLSTANGSVMLTSKEHRVANELQSKYYLFVVRNFNNAPFHTYFANPLNSKLHFTKSIQTINQISWNTNIQA